MAQPPRKWAVIGIPKISPQCRSRAAASVLGQPAREVVADRQPGWAWLTVALPARQPWPEEAPFRRYGKGVVVSLHDEGNYGAFRPRSQVKRLQHRARVASSRHDPTSPAWAPLRSASPGAAVTSAVHQQRAEKAHHVGTMPVPDGLGMRTGLRVKRGGYCHAAAEIGVGTATGDGRPQQGLGIGPGQLAEARRQLRELAFEDHRLQQLLGAKERRQRARPGRQSRSSGASWRGRPVPNMVVLSVRTSHPPPGLGSSERTVVRGTTTAPARSARWR